MYTIPLNKVQSVSSAIDCSQLLTVNIMKETDGSEDACSTTVSVCLISAQCSEMYVFVLPGKALYTNPLNQPPLASPVCVLFNLEVEQIGPQGCQLIQWLMNTVEEKNYFAQLEHDPSFSFQNTSLRYTCRGVS